jgi:hypothetical protein
VGFFIPNVPIMEIYYIILCEASFISKESMAAKEGIFTTLSKEPQAELLVWGEKRIWNLYPLKMAWV